MIELLRYVANWWLVFFLLGISVLPFTAKLFGNFFDKGYAFSKIIGLMLLSYIMYIMSTVHILPFTFPSLVILFILILGASGLFYIRSKNELQFKKNIKIFFLEEILFLLALFFWSYIKSFQPDIHGLEKFMDYGFINSILRTAYFPPKDMWFAPLTINYYYFGHLMTAVATRLSLLPSNITFDLMLATIFAFAFTESFSLGTNFIFFLQKQLKQKQDTYRMIFVGLLAAIFLTLGGNLHTIYTLFTPYQNDTPVPPTQLKFSPQTFPNQYWYPNATRFIYHTIHEFPIYSFVVSDLHGHVLDIPGVLLMLSLIFLFLMQPLPKGKNIFFSVFLFGALNSILYMTNAWDGLIYTGVVICVFFAKFFTNSIWETLKRSTFLLSIVFLLFCFVIVGLPFSLFFVPFASQIGVNCAPQFLLAIGHIGPIIFEKGYCQYSPVWQLAILWGFFFFWFISLLVFCYTQYQQKKPIILVDRVMIAAGILGFALIIVPEFVYLKDIYTTYFRANTMFKLVYQAFIILSLMSTYTIYRVFTAIKQQKKQLVQKILSFIYIVIAIILMSFVLIYPYFAIMSYFNNLSHFEGLNGITYLKGINADDYAAVQWINKNIKGQPTMLEAQGDSYTDYERISANTGLPTVMGWMVHEWLWRGYTILPQRIADVQTIYVSRSSEQTLQLIKQYGVTYVYIGDMERTKYPGLNEEKFAELGKLIYSHGSVQIYKITAD